MKKTDKLNKVKGYVIHCKSIEDARKLCSVLNINGYKWRDGTTYDVYNNWQYYKEDTCYNPYEGLYARLEYYKYNVHKDHDYDISIINVDDFLKII